MFYFINTNMIMFFLKSKNQKFKFFKADFGSVIDVSKDESSKSHVLAGTFELKKNLFI